MKPRLISLDIDGTILDITSGLSVPTEVREAVNEARVSGVFVCLCSSRTCFMMEDAMCDLDDIDALIGCSGASIEIANADNRKARRGFVPIYYDILSAQYVETCIEIANEWDIYASFAAEEKLIARKKNSGESYLENDPLLSFVDERELLSALNGHNISCAFLFGESKMPKDFLIAAQGLEGATVKRSSEDSYIITNPGVDKGTGLAKIAAYLDIPMEQTLAIGNDENDIPMLIAAGMGVAVANASPEVLAVADWVAPDVRDAGAAAAIRRFALLP